MSSLSIILLTHATSAHIAAFAHCCKHVPSFTQIPVYATSPVINFGRTLLQDIYSSTPLASTIVPPDTLSYTSFDSSSPKPDSSPQILLQPPTTDEIASYFARIHPLKYSQPHQPLPSPFSPPLTDLTITAYNAGHTLGGTIWRIQHGMESIVYAVDWNHARENVLAGAAWLGGSGGGGAEVIEELRKPTALVCSARGAEKNALAGGRKKRDDLLLDMIRSTVAKGGTVLIPTDTSARVLELAYILENAWRKDSANNTGDNSLKRAKLYLASRNVGATMRYARSMLEWMDESVVRELETEPSHSGLRQHKRNLSNQMHSQDSGNQGAGKSSTPFDFRYLKLVEHRKRIERLISAKGPRVILASDTSLAWGFSREILQSIAADPTNLIILTKDYGKESNSNVDKDSLGATLLQWYHERRDGVAMEKSSDGQILEQVHSGGRQLRFKDAQRVSLEGKELLIYQQYLASRRQSVNFSRLSNGTALETAADAIDDTSSSSSSSSEESDPERQGKALNTTAKTARFNRTKVDLGSEILGINVLVRQKGVYDYDVRGKKGREQMFPIVNKRRRADDFGDMIRPEDYLRAEERDEVDGEDMRNNDPRKQTSFGQKRKWQDSGLQADGAQAGSHGKRRQSGKASNNELNPMVSVNPGVNGHAGDGEDDSLGESEDELEVAMTGPSKITFKVNAIVANLRIAYIDFAGLHDQRGLSNLIPLIQPKKLLLVSGNPSETMAMAEECRQKLKTDIVDQSGKVSETVFAPTNGQTVDASVDTNAWTVNLSELLTRRLHWQNVKDLQIVTLMGHLEASTVGVSPADAPSRKKLKMLNLEDDGPKMSDIPVASEKAPVLAPVLDILPDSMAAATRSVTQPLHVGDLRLADLRKILQSKGHTAEFRGEGTLLVDGVVAMRKTGAGKIEVEGGGLNLPEIRTRTLEESFHAVKRNLYNGLAVVAGS